MRIVGEHSPRELRITLAIWAVLLALSCAALYLLSQNAVRIINHIHYVNVTRGQKAEVLYAEAEKNARVVLKQAEKINTDSAKKVAVPLTDEHLQKSIELFDKAGMIDPQPEFSPERIQHYELLAQVYDAAGNHHQQLLTHAKALIAEGAETDALDYIRQARELSRDSRESLLLLAQVKSKNGKTTEALTLLDESGTHTLSAKGHFIKGGLLAKLGNATRAISQYKQAVAQQPDSLDYRKALANKLASEKKIAEACAVLKPLVSKAGWYDAAYLHVYGIFLIDNHDYDEAIRVLSQADKLAPYSGDIQFTLANAYHLNDQPRQAAYALRRATEVKPSLQNKIF